MKKETKRANITFVIDRSGSMSCIDKETIDSYNNFIQKERKNNINIKVTTVLFNNYYKTLYKDINITNVPKLTLNDYNTHGCTALLDAVGYTLASYKHNNKKEKNMFVIITDGLENSSREFSRDNIKSLISKYNNTEFIFLGANIDSFKESDSLGIDKNNTANFEQTEKCMSSIFGSLSKILYDENVNLQEEINKES